MKIFIATMLLFLFTGLSSQACPTHHEMEFTKSGLKAHLEWVVIPDGKGGESILRVQFTKLIDGSAIEPKGFAVVLWMPSMNHGSAPTQIQRAVDQQGNIIPGTFDVRNMYFLMPGDWEVRFTLKNENISDEIQVWAFSIEGDHQGGGHHHGGHHAIPNQ
jgi:hypothetical protein